MSEFLSHPLVLLIIGAGLTGLLVPFIAGHWQRQKQAHETRSEIILDITGLITEMMLEPIMRIGADSPEAVITANKALKEEIPGWLQRNATIKTRLALYFPRSRIADKWEILYVAVFNFVTFGTHDTREDRNADLAELAEYLGERGKEVNWGLLARKRDRLESDSLKDQHFEFADYLRGALYDEMEVLAGLMLRTRTYGEFSLIDWFKEN